MAEDGVEKTFRELIKLDIRRKEAGQPSQEQIDSIMREFFPSVRSNIIDELGERRSALLEYLTQYMNVQKNARKSLSKPFLCATFLEKNVSDECMDAARNANSGDSIEKFRFFFDFAIGLKMVLSRVVRAEDELSDRGEERRLKVAFYESKALNMPAGEAAEEYLHMRRDAVDSLTLLRKDPSGFLLLDSCVEKVKAGSDLPVDLYTKEYVVAGAELARDLYKKVYEIAEPLYPQQKQK